MDNFWKDTLIYLRNNSLFSTNEIALFLTLRLGCGVGFGHILSRIL